MALREIRRKIGSKVPKPVWRFVRRFTVVPYRRTWGPRIPIAMITGTKGKTTTTRMLAHILTEVGHRVGLATSDGVAIDGDCVSRYDAGGYLGAREVFSHRDITAAVLETARGGLLRHGFYIDRCDAAALLNVEREQIEMDGVETLEDMAALKRRVIDASRGAVILNADDALCREMIGDYPPGRTILFSRVPEDPLLRIHLGQGGRAFVAPDSGGGGDGEEGAAIERWEGEARTPVVALADLPSYAKGVFPQNATNALAAAALAEGLAIPMESVAAALRTFEPSLEQSPGRLNFFEGYAPTILLDRAAHAPSAVALVESVDRIAVSGQKLCMVETLGNRPDWHYEEFCEVLGPHFDRFVCYEVEQSRRGREPGEILNLLNAGLLRAGVSPDRIETAQDYRAAAERLAELAGPDDLLVILASKDHNYLPIIREVFARHRLDRSP